MPTVHDPLGDLVVRAGRGDGHAANTLVRSLLPRVHRTATRILFDVAEAEDVAQEAFMRAWKAAPSWKPGAAKFETWLHRVTLNLCFDRLRRRRRLVGGDAVPDQIDPGPRPGDGLVADDRVIRVRQAMAALPERQRAALALCHFEDMGNIEAAAAMEISVEALESLLSRGRRALRVALSDEAANLLGPLEAEG